MEIYKTNEEDKYKNDKCVIVLDKNEVYDLLFNLLDLKLRHCVPRISTKLREGLEKIIE